MRLALAKEAVKICDVHWICLLWEVLVNVSVNNPNNISIT